MSKKILKRSLALGALMAFVITGSAMSVAEATYYAQAKGNKEAVYSDTVSGEEDKQRVLGGWDNPDRALTEDGQKDENATQALNSKFTVTGGTWDSVVGGHWVRDYKVASDLANVAPLEVDVTSTNTTIVNATVKTVIGGSASVNYQNLSITGDTNYKLTINGGEFGHEGYEAGGNVPSNFVAGGDLLKYSTSWSAITKDDDVYLKSVAKSTDTSIVGGTFNSAIVNGSVAMAYYDPSYKNIVLHALVDTAKTTITGGTFNQGIIAGGFAWGKDAKSEVNSAELSISGTSGNLEVNNSIFSGGMRNENNALGIATVGTATINIYNAAVKNIYGTGAILRNLASGNDAEWAYIQNEDDIVNTKLSLTNVTADDVVIPNGSVSLRVEDSADVVGKIKIGTSENTRDDITGLDVPETEVPINIEANGEVNDAYNGDYKAMLKDRFDVEGYALVDEDEETGETTLNATSLVMEEGEIAGETIVTTDEETGKTIVNQKANVGNTGIKDIAAVGLMAWRNEMNDMNKRLGELRDSKGEHGVWVRMVNGEAEYGSVENEYKTYQLGYDEKLSTDPSWTVGIALSYTEGDNTFSKGSGENDHKGINIYGSKLNDDGSYIDLIAKYACLEHDFNLGTAKGDWDANGYSISAEYGKRFQQGNGLWVEPQVELSYGKVASAEYMVGGRTVNQEGMESLVGRVGFRLGKDLEKGNVYARASYLYDFEGETDVTFGKYGYDESFKQDLGGGWWEVGVGTNINLSDVTHLYLDVEKTFGGEVDTNWQWNLGVRYSF